jgi:hypothetical protein
MLLFSAVFFSTHSITRNSGRERLKGEQKNSSKKHHCDSLGPLNGSGDHRLGARTRTIVEKVIGGFEVTSHQDSRHDREHALSTFIQRERIPSSCFVRYSVWDRPIQTLADIRDLSGASDRG